MIATGAVDRSSTLPILLLNLLWYGCRLSPYWSFNPGHQRRCSFWTLVRFVFAPFLDAQCHLPWMTIISRAATWGRDKVSFFFVSTHLFVLSRFICSFNRLFFLPQNSPKLTMAPSFCLMMAVLYHLQAQRLSLPQDHHTGQGLQAGLSFSLPHPWLPSEDIPDVPPLPI